MQKVIGFLFLGLIIWGWTQSVVITETQCNQIVVSDSPAIHNLSFLVKSVQPSALTFTDGLRNSTVLLGKSIRLTWYKAILFFANNFGMGDGDAGVTLFGRIWADDWIDGSEKLSRKVVRISSGVIVTMIYSVIAIFIAFIQYIFTFGFISASGAYYGGFALGALAIILTFSWLGRQGDEQPQAAVETVNETKDEISDEPNDDANKEEVAVTEKE